VTTLEQLTQVFQRVFDDPSLTIKAETTASDVPGWDSLSHVNLILVVEQTFQVKFSNKDLLVLQDVGDLVACIDRHRAKNALR
jgi:acyl carrier protein